MHRPRAWLVSGGGEMAAWLPFPLSAAIIVGRENQRRAALISAAEGVRPKWLAWPSGRRRAFAATHLR